MNLILILDPLAKLDIDDNIDWYEEKQVGLGSRFYDKVKTILDLIEQNPYIFPVKYKNTRTAPVSDFPFTVHYFIDKQNMVVAVLCIFKTPQSPQKWKKRT